MNADFKRITPEEVVSAMKAIDATPMVGKYYSPPNDEVGTRACACGIGALAAKREMDLKKRPGLFFIRTVADIEAEYLGDYTDGFIEGFDDAIDDDSEKIEEKDGLPLSEYDVGYNDGFDALIACEAEFKCVRDLRELDDDETWGGRRR